MFILLCFVFMVFSLLFSGNVAVAVASPRNQHGQSDKKPYPWPRTGGGVLCWPLSRTVIELKNNKVFKLLMFVRCVMMMMNENRS
jgi:hypothetical protein